MAAGQQHALGVRDETCLLLLAGVERHGHWDAAGLLDCGSVLGPAALVVFGIGGGGLGNKDAWFGHGRDSLRGDAGAARNSSIAWRNCAVNASDWRAVRPVVGIGVPMRSSSGRGLKWRVWMGSSSKVPIRAMGIIGTPARMAMYAGPLINGPSRPSRERPPSGKTKSGMPALRARTPPVRLAMEARGLSTATGIWPERSRCQPMKGIFQRSLRARIRNWNGSAAKMAGVSI